MLQTMQRGYAGDAQIGRAAETPTEFGHILSRIAESNNSLESIAARLDGVLARLTGSLSGETLAADKPRPPGVLNEFRDQVSNTAHLADKLDAMVIKLSEIV